MKMSRAVVVFAAVFCLASTGLAADEPTSSWPEEVRSGDWIITMYQPQVDSFEGNRLEARAAVSVKSVDGAGEPTFGAVWISANVDVDREARVVNVRSVEIPGVRFADSQERDREALAQLLETEMPRWEITMDLDHLIAGLGADAEHATTPGLKNDPPVFVHSTEPAVLLQYDGEPKTEVIRGREGFERIVNTPFPVVRQKGGKSFYLFGGEEYWYMRLPRARRLD